MEVKDQSLRQQVLVCLCTAQDSLLVSIMQHQHLCHDMNTISSAPLLQLWLCLLSCLLPVVFHTCAIVE